MWGSQTWQSIALLAIGAGFTLVTGIITALLSDLRDRAKERRAEQRELRRAARDEGRTQAQAALSAARSLKRALEAREPFDSEVTQKLDDAMPLVPDADVRMMAFEASRAMYFLEEHKWAAEPGFEDDLAELQDITLENLIRALELFLLGQPVPWDLRVHSNHQVNAMSERRPDGADEPGYPFWRPRAISDRLLRGPQPDHSDEVEFFNEFAFPTTAEGRRRKYRAVGLRTAMVMRYNHLTNPVRHLWAKVQRHL